MTSLIDPETRPEELASDIGLAGKPDDCTDAELTGAALDEMCRSINEITG